MSPALFTTAIQIPMIICIMTYAFIYLTGILQGKVKPVLATWLLLALATTLSFLTNLAQTGTMGLLANSFNVVDMLATLVLFLTILLRKNLRKNFTRFEQGCLIVVLIVFAGWLASGQNILAHIAIQIILVIAYMPTLVHLWKAQLNTESVASWSLNCIASILGMAEPLRTRDLLPILYTGRAVIFTSLVVFLILRVQCKKNFSTSH